MMHDQDIVDAEYEEISDATKAPQVNVGKIGHVDHGKSTFTEAVLDTANISDTEHTEIDSTEHPNEPNETPKMTKGEILDALKTAHEDGHISGKEVNRMKLNLGIFSSDFTKKKETNKKRKSKRKLQKNARRKQR